MNFMSLMDIFLGLVEGFVPKRFRAPMDAMIGEIKAEVRCKDEHLVDLKNECDELVYEKNQLLKRLDFVQNELRKVRVTAGNEFAEVSDRVAVDILRLLMVDGVDGEITRFHPAICKVIQGYHQDNGKSKIKTIKLYRSLTGCGLKESKEQVEAWGCENP